MEKQSPIILSWLRINQAASPGHNRAWQYLNENLLISYNFRLNLKKQELM